MKRTHFFFLFFLLGAAVSVRAERLNTGAHFLQLGVGAREVAMGGASSALSHDVNALHWNPAGIARLGESQVGFTHAEWLLDTTYDSFGFAVPSKRGAFGFTALRLDQGRQEGRDANRRRSGDFNAADTAVGLGWGIPLGARLGVGGNIKFVQSRIGDASAATGAVDMGLQAALRRFNGAELGLAVRNVGPGLKFERQKDQLPLTFALGYGQPVFSTALLAAEWQYEPVDRSSKIVFGTEYRLVSFLALRGGFLSSESGLFHRGDGPVFNDSNGFVGGFGLKITRFDFDYAFSPFGALGETHRFTLRTKL